MERLIWRMEKVYQREIVESPNSPSTVYQTTTVSPTDYPSKNPTLPDCIDCIETYTEEQVEELLNQVKEFTDSNYQKILQLTKSLKMKGKEEFDSVQENFQNAEEQVQEKSKQLKNQYYNKLKKFFNDFSLQRKRPVQPRLSNQSQETYENLKNFWKNLPDYNPNLIEPKSYIEQIKQDLAYEFGKLETLRSSPTTSPEILSPISTSAVNISSFYSSIILFTFIALSMFWNGSGNQLISKRSMVSNEGTSKTCQDERTIVVERESITENHRSLILYSVIIPLTIFVNFLNELSGYSSYLVQTLYGGLILAIMVMLWNSFIVADGNRFLGQSMLILLASCSAFLAMMASLNF